MTWELLLLLAVVLACPISMWWMMRSRRGEHGGDGMRGMGGMCGMGRMSHHEPRDASDSNRDRATSTPEQRRPAAQRNLTIDAANTPDANGARRP